MHEGRTYLDYAATTPIREEVLNSMLPYMSAMGANPAASYTSARLARRALEDARERTASALGAEPSEIFFTSGGTESDNWALRALLRDGKDHIVTSTAEHHAVLKTCAALQSEGCRVSYLGVDQCARTDPDEVGSAVERGTALVSIMYANNEIGTVNNVREIAAAAHKSGAAFHADAVAACGHVRINVRYDDVDMLSVSAHKFYGPVGVGALYVRDGLSAVSFMHGGRQERGLRAGTQNVAGAVGLASALELALAELEYETARLRTMRNEFRNTIRRIAPHAVFLTPDQGSLPGTLTVLIPGLDATAALIQLDRDGIEISTGAACSSGAQRPSHVLTACGLNTRQARSVLRISLGRFTSEQDAELFAKSLQKVLRRTGSAN